MGSRKSLKILHLTTHLNIGGVSSYIATLGSGLLRKYYEIWVLSAGGVLEEDFQKKGFKCVRFPIRTKSILHPKLYLALPGIIQLVKTEGFDVLHAHSRISQVLAYFISLVTKVPYVSTAHGFYKPRFGRRVFGSWGSRVIAISPLVAEDLEKSHAVPKTKIRLIPNAVDVQDFQNQLTQKNRTELRKEYGIEENAVVLGSISRLVRDKGHEYLIRAVEKLSRKYPAIFLLILGDGRERDALQKLITELHLESRARVLEASKDVASILSMMDIFVHPATYREGFGLSIAEAMIAGKPVIASNIWAINSIIQDGVNGLLVEPKNVDGLVKSVSFMIDQPGRAKEMAAAAYAMTVKLCSLDRMVSDVERVYEEVLSESYKRRYAT